VAQAATIVFGPNSAAFDMLTSRRTALVFDALAALNDVVLDILVQARRDADAWKRFFRRLLKGLQYVTRRCGHW
jgi:hypothetical protein